MSVSLINICAGHLSSIHLGLGLCSLKKVHSGGGSVSLMDSISTFKRGNLRSSRSSFDTRRELGGRFESYTSRCLRFCSRQVSGPTKLLKSVATSILIQCFPSTTSSLQTFGKCLQVRSDCTCSPEESAEPCPGFFRHHPGREAGVG